MQEGFYRDLILIIWMFSLIGKTWTVFLFFFFPFLGIIACCQLCVNCYSSLRIYAHFLSSFLCYCFCWY